MKAQGPFSFTGNSKCDLGSGCFVPYKQPTIMRINVSFICSVPLVWRGGWATNIIFTLECLLILIHKYTLVVVVLARYR